MNEQPDAGDTLNTHDEHIFCRDRRNFLAALAATSAGLLMGAPSFAEAAATKSALQLQVGDLVKRMRNQGLLSASEKTSWSVYDFTSGTKLVSINEGIPRQAASMVKPFVAQAFFLQMESARKPVRYTDDVRRTMERMIQHSSNTATNRIMDLVSASKSRRGPADVEAVLKQQAPGVFKETHIVEKIPSTGQTYRNLASAHDYSRYLVALRQGRLPQSQEQLRLMGLPSGDRLADGSAGLPDAARVYNKTGSTAMLCGDMGIIEIPDRRGRRHAYTMIGIIERTSRTKNYGSWISGRGNVIRRVSNLVYLDMKRRYGLV